MRALVKSAPAPGLDLREVAEPDPGPGEVVIAVGAAAVCGSDVARYEWAEPYWSGNAKDMTRDLPRVLGHEFAGTVVGLGLEQVRSDGSDELHRMVELEPRIDQP